MPDETVRTAPPAPISSAPAVVMPAYQPLRNPSSFRGDPGEDPITWLKEYDRVAKFNRWDDTISLANAFFFLEGTARQWFENNEDVLTTWEKFEAALKKTFGDSRQCVRKAEEQLKCRAQKHGESAQSYIQSVLGLCHQVNAAMTENEKLSHLMKGVAEDIYQALIIKEIESTADFIKWCQKIEDMQQKRISGRKFNRLPNVVQIASLDEQPDLVPLIRQIVQEELQRIMNAGKEPTATQQQTIESLVREEIEKTLAPVSPTEWTEIRPRRKPTYANVVRRQRPIDEPQRKTDVWRTEDNRPVCFHCGRPGHVVRYCRERKAIFDDYRAARTDARRFYPSANDEHVPGAARNQSPSPNRGRSPSRRFSSPSPSRYRRNSRSPSRNEEN